MYAQGRIENLSKILQDTENSRFGQVAHIPYSNSPSAVAESYGFSMPGSASTQFFQSQPLNVRNNSDFVKSIGGALGGVVGSFMPSSGSQIVSMIGSGLGSVFGTPSSSKSSKSSTIRTSITQAAKSVTDWFFNKVDQVYKSLDTNQVNKSNISTAQQSSKPQSQTQLSPVLESARKTVNAFIETATNTAGAVIDSMLSPVQAMYSSMTKSAQDSSETRIDAPASNDSSGLSLFSSFSQGPKSITDQFSNKSDDVEASNKGKLAPEEPKPENPQKETT
jgi:hypothetical protein